MFSTPVQLEVKQILTAKKENEVKLTMEQLHSLAASFLPVIREFYESERGKKVDTAAV